LRGVARSDGVCVLFPRRLLRPIGFKAATLQLKPL
jgi:hypothetical protein